MIRPPFPKSPHFPLRQNSIRPLKTIATTAVVKNVLQRRALRHLNNFIGIIKEKSVKKCKIHFLLCLALCQMNWSLYDFCAHVLSLQFLLQQADLSNVRSLMSFYNLKCKSSCYLLYQQLYKKGWRRNIP